MTQQLNDRTQNSEVQVSNDSRPQAGSIKLFETLITEYVQHGTTANLSALADMILNPRHTFADSASISHNLMSNNKKWINQSGKKDAWRKQQEQRLGIVRCLYFLTHYELYQQGKHLSQSWHHTLSDANHLQNYWRGLSDLAQNAQNPNERAVLQLLQPYYFMITGDVAIADAKNQAKHVIQNSKLDDQVKHFAKVLMLENPAHQSQLSANQSVPTDNQQCQPSDINGNERRASTSCNGTQRGNQHNDVQQPDESSQQIGAQSKPISQLQSAISHAMNLYKEGTRQYDHLQNLNVSFKQSCSINQAMQEHFKPIQPRFVTLQKAIYTPGKWLENIVAGLQRWMNPKPRPEAYQQVASDKQTPNNAQSDKFITSCADQMFFHKQLHKLKALQQVEQSYQQLQPNNDQS